MRWETNNGFYEDNKDYVHTFIIIMAVCIIGVWLCYDYYRNDGINHDTDNAVERIEERIKNIERRVDRIQERNTAIEKAVQRIGGTINAGRENAVTVADGIERADKRLDGIIQRQGRIENILNNIETANRQRTQSSPQTDLAK